MKTLYIDCGMGAAGDMLTAALLDLLDEDERAEALKEISEIGLEGVETLVEKSEKCGISGLCVRVKADGAEEVSEDDHEYHHDHHHEHGHHHHDHDFEDDCEHHHDHHHEHGHHHHDHDFEDDREHHHHHQDHDHDNEHEHHHHHHASREEVWEMIDDLKVPEKIKRQARDIYDIIADAESKAHGVDVGEVHFHEVGMKDAVMDVVSVCLLMDRIGADRIVASPVHVGSGKVRCAHGIMPVPAPATAEILKGVPIYGGRIEGELCTPTGAALLKYFADSFGTMPVMTLESVGYGMGKKDFEAANCVRLSLGESAETSQSANAPGLAVSPLAGDIVVALECNVDDMTGEEIGYSIEKILESGARECFAIPVIMKKSRPGHLIKVLCDPEKEEEMVREIFVLTSTIGIRKTEHSRYTLERTVERVSTPDGEVRVKYSRGYGVERIKAEYDDVRAIAGKKGISVRKASEDISRYIKKGN